MFTINLVNILAFERNVCYVERGTQLTWSSVRFSAGTQVQSPGHHVGATCKGEASRGVRQCCGVSPLSDSPFLLLNLDLENKRKRKFTDRHTQLQKPNEAPTAKKKKKDHYV